MDEATNIFYCHTYILRLPENPCSFYRTLVFKPASELSELLALWFVPQANSKQEKCRIVLFPKAQLRKAHAVIELAIPQLRVSASITLSYVANSKNRDSFGTKAVDLYLFTP